MNFKNFPKVNLSAVAGKTVILLIVFLVFGIVNQLEAKQFQDASFDTVPLKKLPLKESVNYKDQLPPLETGTEAYKIAGWLWPERIEYIDGFDIVCKLKLSERFDTIIVRKKTEYEIEAFLVNYDKSFNKMDILRISYGTSNDAEYQNSVTSAEIKENEIITTTDYYDYLTETDGVEKVVYSVSDSGKFEEQKRKDVKDLPLVEFIHEREFYGIELEYEKASDEKESKKEYFINLSEKFESKVVTVGNSVNKNKTLVNFTVDKRNNEKIIDSLEIASGSAGTERSAKSEIDKNKITVYISGSESGENKTLVYSVMKDGKFKLEQETKTKTEDIGQYQ